jgi:hypothetical protein
MSNTTIYISSKDQKLKDWTDLFCKNLSMISTQFFGSNETIEVVSFEGKLSTADKHIFILSDDTAISNIEVSSNNLFQVHLTPISFNNIPSFLYQAPLFEFFNTDLTHNTSTWIDLDVSTGNSWEKLLDFTKRIFNIYKKDKQIIYLAKTSLNQIANRDLLKRDLLNQGFNVIPEHPLNDSSADILKEQIDTLIKDASLSIHIYGNDSSKELNQDFEIVEFQNKLCAKSANTNLQRLIWLPSDVRLDKENEEKISILRKDLEMLKGAEFVEAPLELFKSLVYQKIENISELNKDQKSGLYLIYDNKDNKDIEKIKAEIQKNNLNVLIVNNLEEHPLLNHKNNLSNSNGIIIYYDGSNSNWIENILNDIIKAPKYRNNKQINSIGLVSNSELVLKQELESYKLEKIDIADQTQLETFIQNINK